MNNPGKIPDEFDGLHPDKVIGHGGGCVAYLTKDGSVLKIGHDMTKHEMRFFDLKALDFGVVNQVPYIVQPFARMARNEDDLDEFIEMIGSDWKLWDGGMDQIGRLPGEGNSPVLLVDYWAVVSLERYKEMTKRKNG